MITGNFNSPADIEPLYVQTKMAVWDNSGKSLFQAMLNIQPLWKRNTYFHVNVLRDWEYKHAELSVKKIISVT